MGVFWSGALADGNNGFTRGSFLPLSLLEKGGEVANLVDSFLMKNKNRAPAAIASKHRIEPRKRSRCFRIDLPTLHTDRHLVVRKRCSRVDRPTPQTDRHRLVRERGGRTRLREKATRRRRSYIAARLVPGRGSVK